MNIDSIVNGFVIDHIQAGKSMEIYRILNLENLDCPVAIIKNVHSKKMGRKDIIKIDALIDLNLDVLGFIDPTSTVSVVKDGEIVEKRRLALPDYLHDVLVCKNPRCITSIEQELEQVFRLTDRNNRIYRCVYCETKAELEQL